MVRDAPEGGGARYRFDVEPADIRGYAGQLYRASEHGEKAIDYLKKYSELDSGLDGSWLSSVDSEHEKVVKHVEAMLDGLRQVCRWADASLTASANHYDGTDSGAAEHLASEDRELPHYQR
ncbi:type VII secretion target [Actinocatenispora comari]|jgi:hypothetical protein|uniref:Uncharacterized protein n=1 Tax=Actinocatenispora comari TaxID=2807577 RepID=A0A8J4AMQ0_9ACTN|nr:type VII secretion target [Actinocatenispora comari]GIL31653.1 hypothetical protein NUM_69070 [Actinocatenispora comari]